MKKHVAVLAVNPVNGLGLFNYLESFYENGISYKVYAVSADCQIHTNSGISLKTDDVIANLKGHANDFDALVFACGDAIPVYRQYEDEAYNKDLLEVIREFVKADKYMIGHCAASMMFEIAGVTCGKRLAVHPLAKPAIQQGIATDDAVTIEGRFLTAQNEHTLPELMPHVLEVLK